MARVNRVLELLAREQIDCVIIKDVTTIRYITGFSGDSSLFYLAAARAFSLLTVATLSRPRLS